MYDVFVNTFESLYYDHQHVIRYVSSFVNNNNNGDKRLYDQDTLRMTEKNKNVVSNGVRREKR